MLISTVEIQTISLILFLILTLWLIILSVFVFRTYRHFTHLVDRVRGENLINILEKILKEEQDQRRAIQDINKEIIGMQKESNKYLQKVGLMRFNPFSDTGGEQSFTLGLLDKLNNGVILTGLHTRERTRVYVKSVQDGKSKTELSKEEDKALSAAIKQ